MNEDRQRATRAIASGLVALSVLGSSSACDARSPAEGAQTAVVVAQTAVPGAQTALPGLQATAQAGSTLAARLVADPQSIAPQLQLLLAGVAVDVRPEPSGADNASATRLTITASDARGAVTQMDPATRQAAVGAALLLAAQSYPNATISLAVVDGAGQRVLGGTKSPGQAPQIQ